MGESRGDGVWIFSEITSVSATRGVMGVTSVIASPLTSPLSSETRGVSVGMSPFAVSMREKRVSVGCGATVIVSVTGGVGVDIMGELVMGDSEERIEIEVFAGVISNHDIRFMSGLSIATIDQACISVFGDVSIIIFTPVASRARESIGSTIIGDSVVHFREIGSIGISVETISADEVLLDSGTPLTTNQTELSAKSISPPISKDTIVSALTEEFP